MASVRKRNSKDPSSPWIVAYSDQSGKRHIKTFDKKKDADRYRNQVETEVESGTHVARRDTVTFGEACNAWLNDNERRWRIGDRMAGTTVKNYENIGLRHLIPKFGKRKLTDMPNETLQEYLDGLAEQYSRPFCADVRSSIRLVFTHAVRKKWLVINPVINEPIRLVGKEKRRAIPSKEEIRQILAALTTRAFRERAVGHQTRMIVVLLALFAGLRRGEMAGLQWENIDLEKGIISIRHSLSVIDGLKEPKSRAGVRTVVMAEPIRQLLGWVREQQGGERKGYVITTRQGTPICPSNLYWHWKVTMHIAGLVKPAKGKTNSKKWSQTPIYPLHSLRHAAVSLLIDQGLEPFHIKSFIGHHSIRTTLDIYGHMFPENEATKAAVSQVGRQFIVDLPSAQPRLIRDLPGQVIDI